MWPMSTSGCLAGREVEVMLGSDSPYFFIYSRLCPPQYGLMMKPRSCRWMSPTMWAWATSSEKTLRMA